MNTPWRLVFKHLRVHWVRTILTASGMVVALFLFCFLASLITTLDKAVAESASNRVVVQSAVSLYVSLPLDYHPKIQNVPGVDMVSKFTWFGGYYQDRANFFAQFATDHQTFFAQYSRDLRIVEGPPGYDGSPAEAALAALEADKRGCVIGRSLAEEYGWKIGDTIPLVGTIFVKENEESWEFNVVGIYEALKSNVDEQTFYFRFDYLEETLDQGGAMGPRGTGTYLVNLLPGEDSAVVNQRIDELFENGPQVTKTSTEAAFQAGFVSMLGNLPAFLGTIGGAVIFAVFFSLVNTMLMASRQRTREAGILKALGFTNGVVARLLFAESLLISLLGGGAGCLLAVLAANAVRSTVARIFPNFAVDPATLIWGVGISVGIGVVSALAPALLLARLRPVDALRSEG